MDLKFSVKITYTTCQEQFARWYSQNCSVAVPADKDNDLLWIYNYYKVLLETHLRAIYEKRKRDIELELEYGGKWTTNHGTDGWQFGIPKLY